MLRCTVFSLFFALIALPAYADNHISAAPLTGQHESLSASHAQVIDLGQDVYRGVIAQAQLNRLIDSAASAGKVSYLLSVSFVDEKRGVPMADGDVAVKITAPDASVAQPIRLQPIGGTFQADIYLESTGESLLTIGSKLSDEKKRIYRFFHSAYQ